MKKLFLLTLVFSLTIGISAQKGYTGMMETGYAPVIISSQILWEQPPAFHFGDNAFHFATVHGYSFNPHFFLGGGIGYVNTSVLRRIAHPSPYNPDLHIVREEAHLIPVFIRYKANLLKEKIISPFLSFDGGYTIDLKASQYVQTRWILRPSIGTNITVHSRLWAYFSFGMNFQQLQYEESTEFSSREFPKVWLKSLDFRIGFQF